MRKILILGATGMLAGYVRHCLIDESQVYAQGRQSASLEALSQGSARLPGRLKLIQADWYQPESFQEAIESALSGSTPQLVVNWIHSRASDALVAVADVLSSADQVIDFYDIFGSTGSAKGRQLRIDAMKEFPILRYRNIILGHKIDNGVKRWLSHEEIVAGVVEAVELADDTHIVGRI